MPYYNDIVYQDCSRYSNLTQRDKQSQGRGKTPPITLTLDNPPPYPPYPPHLESLDPSSPEPPVGVDETKIRNEDNTRVSLFIIECYDQKLGIILKIKLEFSSTKNWLTLNCSTCVKIVRSFCCY